VNAGSLRTRVTIAVLLLLALVLAGVVAAVTLAYRSSLDGDLRNRLRSAAAEFGHAPTDESTKVLIGNLARQGIAVDFRSGAGPLPSDKQAASGIPPIKTGSDITSRGSVEVLEQVHADGTRVALSASTSPIDREVRRLLLIEIAVALGALALAAVLLQRITRTALRPLTHVARTAARIAGGATSERLRPSRTDTELGSMAAAFDRMVDALAVAVARARESEETMRRFLADASHELRTPVAALQASAETLLREQPGRPRRDVIEARLAGDSARLGRLIDDLLGLARLEASEPAWSPVDLAPVAQAAIDDFGDGVMLDPCETAEVLGDESALARVVRNLLDNARAAAGPAALIHVSVTTYGNHAQLSVCDDGPGVHEADRERIFERFVRLSSNGTGGSGLGLSIARRIARQHNGDVTCDAVQRGARFTLRLPLAR
jgi:two-component system OmpR family sensor kinase